MAIKLTKTIYEKSDVLAAVLKEHIAKEGQAPAGYRWTAKWSQAGVIVEPVTVDGGKEA